MKFLVEISKSEVLSLLASKFNLPNSNDIDIIIKDDVLPPRAFTKEQVAKLETKDNRGGAHGFKEVHYFDPNGREYPFCKYFNAQGLTFVELARRCNVSTTSIHRMCKGYVVAYTTLSRVSAVLDLTSSQIKEIRESLHKHQHSK